MAFVDQAKKSRIAAELRKVMPQGWKYNLAVHQHSTIVCTIAAAPFELIKDRNKSEYFDPETATHFTVNPYHYPRAFKTCAVRATLGSIVLALNTDNYDRSDSQTDYFDCGHYVQLQIGRWSKPFVCTAVQEVAA